MRGTRLKRMLLRVGLLSLLILCTGECDCSEVNFISLTLCYLQSCRIKGSFFFEKTPWQHMNRIYYPMQCCVPYTDEDTKMALICKIIYEDDLNIKNTVSHS